MPNNFSFFEFVMVKSSSLIFAFSVPLTIKWHLSKLSLNMFSLNQLKCRIDKGYYHKGCYHLHNLQSNYCIKVGQSIDPWGTPVSMFCHLLKTFSTFVCCLQFDK